MTPEIEHKDGPELGRLFRLMEDHPDAGNKKREPTPHAVHPAGDILQALMEGRLQDAGFSDVSAAVQSLLWRLFVRYDGDVEFVEHKFKQSWLYRETHWGTGEKKWERLRESELQKALAVAQRMLARKAKQEKPEPVDPNSWPEHLTPLSTWNIEKTIEIVENLLRSKCIHVFAGLFESYKSMAALELAAAIRQQRLAFDYFKILSSYEVLWLCPDMSPELQLEYAENFNLHQDPGFRGLRPDLDIFIAVDSPLLQAAVKDRILILDTMLDYANIKEAFQSHEWVKFFQKLRALIKDHGCEAIVLIAHPTKTGARNTVIDPTEFLKDSVTFGGKIDVGFAFRKIEQTSKILIERIKGRGWKDRNFRFTITTHDENAQSNISRGRFPLVEKPEDCKPLPEQLPAKRKPGPKEDPAKQQKLNLIMKLRDEQKKTTAEIAEQTELSEATIKRWIREARQVQLERQLNFDKEQTHE